MYIRTCGAHPGNGSTRVRTWQRRRSSVDYFSGSKSAQVDLGTGAGPVAALLRSGTSRPPPHPGGAVGPGVLARLGCDAVWGRGGRTVVAGGLAGLSAISASNRPEDGVALGVAGCDTVADMGRGGGARGELSLGACDARTWLGTPAFGIDTLFECGAPCDLGTLSSSAGISVVGVQERLQRGPVPSTRLTVSGPPKSRSRGRCWRS